MGLTEILQLVLGSSGLAGIAFLIFRMGRTVEKVNSTEKNIEKLSSDFFQERKDIRIEIKSENSLLKNDLTSEINEVGGEVILLKKELKEEISKFSKEIKEEIEKSRKDLRSEISSVGGEVLFIREDVKRMQVDVSDIKERVAFMEAFIFFSEFTAESNNSRSEAAKKMWERRKMKKVESKK